MTIFRVDIDTRNSPYKIDRDFPSPLNNKLQTIDWTILCDCVDFYAKDLEYEMAKRKVMAVVFTLLYIGVALGVILGALLVDDKGKRNTIIYSMLATDAVVILTNLIFLRQSMVNLNATGEQIQIKCDEASGKCENVSMMFLRNKNISIACSDALQATIEITVTDHGEQPTV